MYLCPSREGSACEAGWVRGTKRYPYVSDAYTTPLGRRQLVFADLLHRTDNGLDRILPCGLVGGRVGRALASGRLPATCWQL